MITSHIYTYLFSSPFVQSDVQAKQIIYHKHLVISAAGLNNQCLTSNKCKVPIYKRVIVIYFLTLLNQSLNQLILDHPIFLFLGCHVLNKELSRPIKSTTFNLQQVTFSHAGLDGKFLIAIEDNEISADFDQKHVWLNCSATPTPEI